QQDPQKPVGAPEAQTPRCILLENRELMTKREDFRLQGDTGSKTGGDQSEKGNKKRAHRDTTRISRMLGTPAFSARREFSVTTGSDGRNSACGCRFRSPDCRSADVLGRVEPGGRLRCGRDERLSSRLVFSLHVFHRCFVRHPRTLFYVRSEQPQRVGHTNPLSRTPRRSRCWYRSPR